MLGHHDGHVVSICYDSVKVQPLNDALLVLISVKLIIIILVLKYIIDI